jgi:hypothetical protein
MMGGETAWNMQSVDSNKEYIIIIIIIITTTTTTTTTTTNWNWNVTR